MLHLYIKRKKGQKSFPKKPNASGWGPIRATVFSSPKNCLKHLPIFSHFLPSPLWPASVVCLGWLIIRDKNPLIPSPLFFSSKMSHFLARAFGSWTAARRYPAIYYPVSTLEEGRLRRLFLFFSEASPQKHTSSFKDTSQRYAHMQRKAKRTQAHSFWTGLHIQKVPRTHSPWIHTIDVCVPPLSCL